MKNSYLKIFNLKWRIATLWIKSTSVLLNTGLTEEQGKFWVENQTTCGTGKLQLPEIHLTTATDVNISRLSTVVK